MANTIFLGVVGAVAIIVGGAVVSAIIGLIERIRGRRFNF